LSEYEEQTVDDEEIIYEAWSFSNFVLLYSLTLTSQKHNWGGKTLCFFHVCFQREFGISPLLLLLSFLCLIWFDSIQLIYGRWHCNLTSICLSIVLIVWRGHTSLFWLYCGKEWNQCDDWFVYQLTTAV
jgi:hypothetical protein